MKCHEAKRSLDPFMDGELAVPENMEVLAHLNLCRECSGVYEGEKALRAGLRGTLGAERAPEGLADRLSRSLAGGRVTEFPRRRGGALVAAVFFGALVLSMVFSPLGDSPRLLASELVERHEETRMGFCNLRRDDCVCSCNDCSPGVKDPVPRFFKRHVAHDVCTHPLEELGYALVGGHVWEHRGSLVCWTVQQTADGKSITHGLVATPVAAGPGWLELPPGARGRIVLLHPAGPPGLTCVFVLDDASEAARFKARFAIR